MMRGEFMISFDYQFRGTFCRAGWLSEPIHKELRATQPVLDYVIIIFVLQLQILHCTWTGHWILTFPFSSSAVPKILQCCHHHQRVGIEIAGANVFDSRLYP